MPIKRTLSHREDASWALGETYREDLPKGGLLSGLLLGVSGSSVSGATLATEAWKLLDLLGKVEVLANGNYPIISLDWRNLQYCVLLDQHKASPGKWRNYATNTQTEYLFIPFGRYLWDTQYGLDLSRYNRVEIRATNASSATYHSAALSLDINMCLFDQVPGNFGAGFLRKEEFREWTTVASAWEYIELPTQHPIRGVHLQCIPDKDSDYKFETGMFNLAYDSLFTAKDGDMRLFEGSIDTLALQNWYEMPTEVLMSGHIDRTADKGFEMEIGNAFGWATASGSRDGAVSSTIPTMLGDGTDGTQALEAREADSNVAVMVRGFAPYQMVTYHYDRDAQPENLLTFQQHGQIKLDIQTRNAASAADGTNRVIVDSVHQGQGV